MLHYTFPKANVIFSSIASWFSWIDSILAHLLDNTCVASEPLPHTAKKKTLRQWGYLYEGIFGKNIEMNSYNSQLAFMNSYYSY